MNDLWEQEAENWIAWARTPGHDAYWRYRESFFALCPPPGAATLEVGCGEGRVSRDLTARGHRVTSIDASPTLLAAAREADPAGDYRLCRAEALPFGDASFSLVVAYNSLMDVQDMPAAVREAARVLTPDGRLCVCVTHPVNDAGRFLAAGPDAPFRIAGTYLGRRRFDETMERNGLTMTFHGFAHPLEDYARALQDAGLVIDAVREPAPDPADPFPDASEQSRWSRVPMFLMLRARLG